MSVNNLLISMFGDGFNFGSDLTSIRKRFQILSHISVNIFLILTASGHDVFFTIFVKRPDHFTFLFLSCFILGLSLFCLRQGKDHLARQLTVGYLHILHLTGNYSENIPLTMLISLMRVPSICMLLGFSLKSMIFHFLICGLQYIACVINAKQIFAVGLDAQQAKQIASILLAAFLCLSSVILTSFMQKFVETELWKLTYSNFNKSEDLTKEIVQVAEEKNALGLSIASNAEKIV